MPPGAAILGSIRSLQSIHQAATKQGAPVLVLRPTKFRAAGKNVEATR